MKLRLSAGYPALALGVCGFIVVAGLGLANPTTGCELPPLQDATQPRMVYRLDETKSLVRFDAKAFMHDFSGKTSKAQGAIRLSDLERLRDAEACLQVDAASLETGINTRDDIMRKDHLETAKYPTIDFRLVQAQDVRPVADGWDFTARGLLSLHGTEREIRLPIQARRSGDTVRLTAETPIKMTDYRIPIPRFLFFTVEDQVRVSFDLLARRVQ